MSTKKDPAGALRPKAVGLLKAPARRPSFLREANSTPSSTLSAERSSLLWVHDNYSLSYDRASVIDAAPLIVFFLDLVIGSASATRWGWTVGTGFEYALSKHVSAFVEYDFLDCGTRAVKFSCTASGNSNACSAPFSVPSLNINEQMNQVKLGLNVRF